MRKFSIRVKREISEVTLKAVTTSHHINPQMQLTEPIEARIQRRDQLALKTRMEYDECLCHLHKSREGLATDEQNRTENYIIEEKILKDETSN